MYKFVHKHAALLIALVPVMLIVGLKKTFYSELAFAKNVNPATAKNKEQGTSNIVEITPTKTVDMKYVGVFDGNKNSKNEMIILSSLSCESCKKFHNKVYPKLMQYIKENDLDIKFKFEFYIETSGALEALKMLCIDTISNKTRLEIMKAFFANQSQIEKLSPNKQPIYVRNIAKNMGIDKSEITAASESKDLEKSIMSHFHKVNKEIQSQYLPTIILRGQTYTGRVESVDDILDFIKKNIKSHN